MDCLIMTNNPMVALELSDDQLEFNSVSCYELFLLVRDRVHLGYKLLSHPLSGSVKPMESPYKSIMISTSAGQMDLDSLKLIENSIEACNKFKIKFPNMPKSMDEDYQFIDLELIKSALNLR